LCAVPIGNKFHGAIPLFDEILVSRLPLPEIPAASSLAELIFGRRDAECDQDPIFLGHIDDRPVDVSLRTLRHAVLELSEAIAARGLAPGDTVCLVRLPCTSETPVAAMYAALSACGIRVLLPMYLELDRFDAWLREADASAVFWSAHEAAELAGTDADRARFARLSATAHDAGIPQYCLFTDLGVPQLLAKQHDASPSLEDARVRECLAAAGLDSECLLLTTSGTSGDAKLVRYRQRAFIRSCHSWEAAGLFGPRTLGGRGLLLLFGHSMGVRAFWNALWTHQALCMVTPEWFLDKPERVRALLLPMQPQHITGGPAAYRALLELARVFPTLKERCLRTLACAVSSGAPYDPDLSRRVEIALGLPLHNAYGTTETLQVTCSLAPGSNDDAPTALGAPLPGVQIGLERCDGETSLYRMHVSSPFAFAGYVGEGDAPEWLATGDLVELTEGGLLYAGREAHDFTKDGFGLKMPRNRLARSYANLGTPIAHLEFYPLEEEPGLAALVYTGDERVDASLRRRVKALIHDRHERLYLELEDFEFRHLTADRFACVEGEPPQSTKGTVKSREVAVQHRDLVARLTGIYRKDPAITRLEREKFARTSYERLVSPRRGGQLRLLRMDKRYVRALGDRLVHRERGEDVEVVDFVGGFGGNLLGHRHPEVVAAAERFLAGQEAALFDQGAARQRAGELARLLALQVGRRTGRTFAVRLGSTGSEAVEMALAHAALEREETVLRLNRSLRRRFGASHPALATEAIAHNEEVLRREPPRILTIASCFHGHSLGARSALHPTSKKRAPFAPLTALEPIPLPPDGSADLDAIVSEEELYLWTVEMRDEVAVSAQLPFTRIIAAIAEPILGEGGAIEVSQDLLRRLSEYSFPLVIYEIQAGLGRSGSFLASMGIEGDYYLFAKALGGGIAKISALLVDRERYLDRFDDLYSSTFAEDAFSCSVAATTLRLMADERVSERAHDRGKALARSLATLTREFPDVLGAVRGRGLLLGLELATSNLHDSLLLRTLADREAYGALAAAYLLNRHHLRLLPTLASPNTLRIEPSVYIDDAAIDQLAAGLRALCTAVRARDYVELFGFLVEEEEHLADPTPAPDDLPPASPRIDTPAPDAVRVAFVSHFVLPERELIMMAPGLEALSATSRRALFHRLSALMELKPFVSFARNLFEGRVWFASITVPADAATLEQQHRSGDRGHETQRIQDAVDLAASLGCSVVALGGYTSILTADGTAVLPPAGVTVTTGNAFTVAAGVRRFMHTCVEAGVNPAADDTCLGIVGASGNVGSGIARSPALAALGVASLVFVGRNRPRLESLRDEIVRRARAGGAPAPRVSVSTEMTALSECNLIVVATNSNEPLIYRNHVAHQRSVVIGDLSVPPAVSSEVAAMKNVSLVPFSGTVTVPGEPDFVISSHTAPGTVFCCAAEAMILGLEPAATRELALVGRLDPSAVALLDSLGVTHGFTHSGRGGFRTEEIS